MCIKSSLNLAIKFYQKYSKAYLLTNNTISLMKLYRKNIFDSLCLRILYYTFEYNTLKYNKIMAQDDKKYQSILLWWNSRR